MIAPMTEPMIPDGLEEAVLSVLVEQQVAEEPADERPDDARGRSSCAIERFCLPGTMSRARAPAIRPTMMMLMMRPSMVSFLFSHVLTYAEATRVGPRCVLLRPLKHP